MNKQINQLNTIISTFSEKEKELMIENHFAYIFSKSYQFLKVGPDIYRKNDALQEPSLDYSIDDIQTITNGCNQIMSGVGLVPEKPFTGLDVYGFSALFRMFHFISIARKTIHNAVVNGVKGAIDTITFEHQIEGFKVTYNNFCEYPNFDNL